MGLKFKNKISKRELRKQGKNIIPIILMNKAIRNSDELVRFDPRRRNEEKNPFDTEII